MAQSTSCRVTGIALVGVLCALVFAGCGGGSSSSGSGSGKYKIEPRARDCEQLGSNLPLGPENLNELAKEAIAQAEQTGARGLNQATIAEQIDAKVKELCAQRGGGNVLVVDEAVKQVVRANGGRASAPPGSGGRTPEEENPPPLEQGPPAEGEPAPGEPPASGSPPSSSSSCPADRYVGGTCYPECNDQYANNEVYPCAWAGQLYYGPREDAEGAG